MLRKADFDGQQAAQALATAVGAIVILGAAWFVRRLFQVRLSIRSVTKEPGVVSCYSHAHHCRTGNAWTPGLSPVYTSHVGATC